MTQRNITTLGQALEQSVPIIDISSRIHENKNPEFALLSNLGHKPFRIDGRSFECLEGFLQCIKTDDEARQMDFCAMLGRQAKKEGSKIAWKHKQTLILEGAGLWPPHRGVPAINFTSLSRMLSTMRGVPDRVGFYGECHFRPYYW